MYIPICLPLFLVSLVSATLTLISPILVVLLLSFPCQSKKSRAPVSLPNASLFNVVPFFSSRFDFLNAGFRTTSQSVFQFRLFQKKVIAISGETGRKSFLTIKEFDLHSGFKDLLGGIPMVKGVTSDLHRKTLATIYRRLATAQTQDRLERLIPSLLNDCAKTMDSWGKSGTLVPFSTIYNLTFQLSVRSLTSGDIADDEAMVCRLKSLYDMVDEGNTPATVLFPWFPSWGMLEKLYATWRIYSLVRNAMISRIKSGKSRDDTMQMLLDSGDSTTIVVGFTIGLLIAGARSTGTTASWLIIFMGEYPEWQAKAKAEVEYLLFTQSYLAQETSVPSIAAALSQIPLESWESSTPVLDKMINETLRLAQPHTAMRRNLGPDVQVDGRTIPSGAYVLYPFGDVHLNANLYPDPWRFDPNRPRHKSQFSWIGFGGGKNVCLGQRLAKLEMKLLAAMILLRFNYSVVDAKGRVPDPLPRPNWNDILGCRPPKGTCLLGYNAL